jgi:hypothetical protein
MRKQILCLLITLGVAKPLSAHPYFIRLGYSTCTTCHISPQGGSILTAYGEGVERALSLLREPEQNGEEESPRLLYDMRALVVGSSTNGVPASSFQLLASNSFKISEHQRLTSTVSVTSPTLAKGLGGKATVTVPTFVWELRPSEHFELMAGRDTLPTGLGSPDPGTFIRVETDPGSPAYPTQIKGFWRSDRWQLTPYAFGPSGYEAHAAREWGSGVLGGIVLFNQHGIIGVSGDAARGSAFDRRSIGGYARFGFGKLALLAEHEVAARSTNVTTGALIGHTRVVYVPWGWLESWLSTEEFVTFTPTRDHIVRVLPGMQARFSKNMLFGLTSREIFTPKGQTRIYTATLTLKVAN